MEKSSIVDIDATIICERESHKGIIIGRQGSNADVRSVQTARKDIERDAGFTGESAALGQGQARTGETVISC